MGNETSKCYQKRKELGHFEKYLKGKGIDVGAGRDCLKVKGKTIAWDLENGDGSVLAGIGDNSLDFVYSSHFMEHVDHLPRTIMTSNRVLKTGGVLYFTVPDFALYEKRLWPSKFNRFHVRSFSLDIDRNEAGRKNHFHIHNDLKPLLDKYQFDLKESYLEDDHYDKSLAASIDQTRIKERDVLCQICIIAEKIDDCDREIRLL